MTSFDTDSFDRADSSTTLGTTDGGRTWNHINATTGTASPSPFGISSNQAYSVSGTGFSLAYIDTGTVNGYAQSLVHTGSQAAGLVFRYRSVGNYYFYWRAGTQLALYKAVNNSFTGVWASANATSNADHTLRVEFGDSDIILYVDGVVQHSTTDATPLFGRNVGIMAFGDVATRWDDFECGVSSATPGGLSVPALGLPI